MCFLHCLPLQSVERHQYPSSIGTISQVDSQVLRVLNGEMHCQNLDIDSDNMGDVLGDVDHGVSVGGGVGWLDFGVGVLEYLLTLRRKRQAVTGIRFNLRPSHRLSLSMGVYMSSSGACPCSHRLRVSPRRNIEHKRL